MKSKKRSHTSKLSREEQYLDLLSKETLELREKIAKTLPAQNKLLSAHARSFNELALLPVAREQGLDYTDPTFDFDSVRPICPSCGEKYRIRHGGKNKYICNVCQKKYTANHDSISSNSNCSSLKWMQVLLCMLEFYSVDRTCSYCEISRNTYYFIRTRLFYAMSILLQDVKLYGNIQCDNTFARSSYKGMTLIDHDYPEDSPFFEIDFNHRDSRKRGERNHHDEMNDNSVCIFTATDEYGHSFARYVCIGKASSRKLDKSVERTKILSEVPEEDPFPYAKKNAQGNQIAHTPTLLISDKEGAIKVFAKLRQLPFESHVYRRNNVQLRLAAGDHNIQKNNSLHSRLKRFFRDCNYVSTRYLPGYLVFFEFIENTGASDEAISKLFEILAQPGYGKPPEFFENLYTLPNYMSERSDEDNPLHRYSENTCQAVYLYHLKLEKRREITMAEITKKTSIAPKTIRRNYKNFAFAGLLEKVIEKYETAVNIKKSVKDIDPDLLLMYDEYASERRKPYVFRRTQKEFVKDMNLKYNTSYSADSLNYYFKKISNEGFRPPLPDFYEW